MSSFREIADSDDEENDKLSDELLVATTKDPPPKQITPSPKPPTAETNETSSTDSVFFGNVYGAQRNAAEAYDLGGLGPAPVWASANTQEFNSRESLPQHGGATISSPSYSNQPVIDLTSSPAVNVNTTDTRPDDPWQIPNSPGNGKPRIRRVAKFESKRKRCSQNNNADSNAPPSSALEARKRRRTADSQELVLEADAIDLIALPPDTSQLSLVDTMPPGSFAEINMELENIPRSQHEQHPVFSVSFDGQQDKLESSTDNNLTVLKGSASTEPLVEHHSEHKSIAIAISQDMSFPEGNAPCRDSVEQNSSGIRDKLWNEQDDREGNERLEVAHWNMTDEANTGVSLGNDSIAHTIMVATTDCESQPLPQKRKGRLKKSSTTKTTVSCDVEHIPADVTGHNSSPVLDFPAEAEASSKASSKKKKRGRPKRAETTGNSIDVCPEIPQAVHPTNKEPLMASNSDAKECNAVQAQAQVQAQTRATYSVESAQDFTPLSHDSSKQEELPMGKDTVPRESPPPQVNANTKVNSDKLETTSAEVSMESKQIPRQANSLNSKGMDSKVASSHSVKPVFRVGLSKKSRIAPLLRCLPKT